MIDKLVALLEGFDLTKIVPELDTFLGRLELTVRLAVLIGPLLLLGFGIWFYFAPPKEANHKAGFRTYFSMGSVEAWRYAQRLAGMIWGVLGAVLLVVMSIVTLIFAGKEAIDIISAGFTCVVIEAVLVLAGYIVIELLVRKHFDKDGNRRG